MKQYMSEKCIAGYYSNETELKIMNFIGLNKCEFSVFECA